MADEKLTAAALHGELLSLVSKIENGIEYSEPMSVSDVRPYIACQTPDELGTPPTLFLYVEGTSDEDWPSAAFDLGTLLKDAAKDDGQILRNIRAIIDSIETP